MSIEPGSQRWQELVRQGIIKTADRNWWLGDAALEIAPIGTNSAHNGSEAHLRTYADEIGVAYESLDQYRKVASAWPPGNRIPGTAWRVHQALMAQDKQQLIRPGMTLTQASIALGHRNVGRTGPQSSTSERAAAVRDYLADPEVARVATETLVATPSGATQTYQAARKALIEQSRNEQPPPSRPEPDASRERVIRIESIADEVIRSLAEVLDPDTDPLGQRLAFLEENLDALSDHHRQALGRAAIELGARVSAWEDRIRGLAGRTMAG